MTPGNIVAVLAFGSLVALGWWVLVFGLSWPVVVVGCWFVILGACAIVKPADVQRKP